MCGGILGGIAERLNWLAIPPNAAGELRKHKQCCRLLGSGLDCAPEAAVYRAIIGHCGSFVDCLKADWFPIRRIDGVWDLSAVPSRHSE